MKTTRSFFSNGITLPTNLLKGLQRFLILFITLFIGQLFLTHANLVAQSKVSIVERVVDIDPPESYTRGNFNASLEITIQNIGNDTLTNIQCGSNLNSQAFEGIVIGGEPSIVQSNAEIIPTLNPNFNGVINNFIFTGLDGKLAAGQYITVIITIELNPFAVGLGQYISYQSKAEVKTPMDILISDLSDTGKDPFGNNPGQLGNTGGTDDPTLIPTRCNSKYAQSMACNKKVNISLGVDCGTEILPSMFLEGEKSERCDMFFELMFSDKWGNPILPPIDERYHNQLITVKVIDAIYGNSCWGTAFIEDKFGPVIECENDTIYCNELDSLPPPNFYDNCDPNPIMYLIGTDSEKLNCDSLYVKRVIRYYKAIDYHGAMSTCSQIIMLKRIPLDSIVYPPDFTGVDNMLSCNGNYPKDAKGRPSVEKTGAPSINNIPVYPNNNFCNISAIYDDTEVIISNCKKKIIRVWTLVDWSCLNSEVRTWVQTIMITDEEGPIIIKCPSNIVQTTRGGYQCEGEIWLPEIEAYDSCSHDNLIVNITYPGGQLQNSNGGRIVLPYGNHKVTYTVYDECYNATSCTINVEVKDITPPVTVCEGHTTVSINQTGEVHIYADVLDDGTFDDCGLDRIAVKRMDEGANCNAEDTLFMPYVRFCCEDAGDTVMVIFRAWDLANNYNDCMIEVFVQDKLPPIIKCPQDVLIYCDSYIDTTDLSIYGSATSTDNCGVTITETVSYDLSACMTGVITRHFTATDIDGRTDTCSQRIVIRDNNPFDSTGITWPLDYELTDCGNSLHPDSLPDIYGRPKTTDDDCSLVGISYEDDIFEFIPGSNACFKVIRTWSIIDWCNFRYSKGGVKYIKWTHQQVLKVSNSVDPVFTLDCDDKSICTYDVQCKSGYINLEMEAMDDCTPDSLLKWEYHVDFFNDKIYDTLVYGVGNYMNASGDYPIGKHTILWQFKDLCGNVITCLQAFEIVNCKPPTPYCKNGIITDLMPIDTNGDGNPDIGMIEIWASDLDDNSFHPCGTDIILSFSKDTMDSFRTFTCDSLGRREVELWVTNSGSGEQDYCVTFVEIQDNNNACTNTSPSGSIAGRIMTPDDLPVSEVTLEVDQLNNLNSISNNDGEYIIKDIPLNRKYSISANRNIDVLEGVSTRDLVIIQNHLLGKNTITSPYKLLAADVNKTKTVSTSDISLIRKLILGKISSYPKSDAWMFVPYDHQFVDPDNPFLDLIPTQLDINNLTGDMVDMDLIGIKMGDVNGDAMSNGYSMPQIRSGSIKLTFIDQKFRPNELTWVPVYLNSEIQTLGWQMSLKYDNSELEIKGFNAGSMHLDESNYAIHEQKGIVNLSWNKNGVTNFNTIDPLFYIGIETRSEIYFSEVIELNYSGLRDEWYSSTNDINGINIDFRKLDENSKISVAQNNPNPFSVSTSISFTTSQREDVIFEILDCTGKSMYYSDNDYEAGNHMLKIRRDEILGAAGIYYYRVQIGKYTKTFKMVVIE